MGSTHVNVQGETQTTYTQDKKGRKSCAGLQFPQASAPQTSELLACSAACVVPVNERMNGGCFLVQLLHQHISLRVVDAEPADFNTQ